MMSKDLVSNVAVIKMLPKRLLSRYCQSESLSEEGLRDLFERHGVTPNSHDVGCEKVLFKLCLDGKITEGIIRCFLEYFPAAANFNKNGVTPLHAACFNNERVSVNIVRLLVNAAPNSVRSVDKKGGVIFHHLCSSIKVGEASAVQILKFLIEKYPEGVRHVDNKGSLPIHSACQLRSPEFCRILIEAYPGSEQIPDPENSMPPFIVASVKNKKATVEMFYKLNPGVFNMNHAITTGSGEVYDVHPLYLIVMSMPLRRDDPEALVETAKFLLDSSPNMIAEMSGGVAMLNLACTETQKMVTNQSNVNSNLETAIQMIKVIFDAHPEAIEYNRIATNIHNWNQEIQAFINSQLVYARQARDRLQMTTPDDNGQLPLHTALQNNARLGSIKLLVKGNPATIHSPDSNGSLPLHVACQYHDSIAVIQYLVGLDTSTLEAVDNEHNTALHYACRSAKYEAIAMLLEKYDAVSISKQNADGKLPLHLLLDSNEVSDRESIEYTESVFRLLRAYPETVMNYNVHVNEEGASASDDDCSSHDEKRRKLNAD